MSTWCYLDDPFAAAIALATNRRLLHCSCTEPVEHRSWVPARSQAEREAQEQYDREHPCECAQCVAQRAR